MDTITCMSVTKWIHLHGGDDVIRAFFLKVKEILYPGGYFVLEPQPWKSYKSATKKLVIPPFTHTHTCNCSECLPSPGVENWLTSGIQASQQYVQSTRQQELIAWLV